MVNIPVGVGAAVGHSAYTSSKMAQLKVIEYLAAEVPGAFIASVHPGIVETDLMKVWEPDAIKGATRDRSHSMPLDDGEYADFETSYFRVCFRACTQG